MNKLFFALILGFALLVAGCTTPAPNEPVVCTLDAKICPDGSGVGRVPPSCEFAPCPATKNPEFAITSPASGAEITGSEVTVTLSASNFTIGEIGAPDRLNEGHFLWFLDGGEYNVAESTEFTVSGLTAGEHTVKVTMHGNDHSEKGIEKSVTFTAVEAGEPNFSIGSPAEGSTVDSWFEASVVPENFEVVEAGGENAPNQGHFHFFMDDGSYIVVSGTTHAFSNLKPGAHTLRAMMNNNDHSALGEEKTVSFTVETTKPGFFVKAPVVDGNTAVFEIETWNFTIGEVEGANAENKGHFHYFVDDGEYNPLAATTFTLSDLSAGTHKVRVTLQNNDHSNYLINEKTVEQTVEFEVPEGMQ